MSIYNSPQSSLVSGDQVGLMEYTEIGGWLKFFKYINVIELIIVPIIILLFLATFFLEPYETQDLIGLVVEVTGLLPSLILSYLILGKLKLRDVGIPKKIQTLLTWELTLTAVVWAVSYFLFKSDIIVEKPVPITFPIIYYFIWTMYFKKSKRVQGFFGTTYDQK